MKKKYNFEIELGIRFFQININYETIIFYFLFSTYEYSSVLSNTI